MLLCGLPEYTNKRFSSSYVTKSCQLPSKTYIDIFRIDYRIISLHKMKRVDCYRAETKKCQTKKSDQKTKNALKLRTTMMLSSHWNTHM